MRYLTVFIIATVCAIAAFAPNRASAQAASQAATRPRAHDFARWESEIRAFEEADKATPPAKGGILFTGALTIRRWKSLEKDFEGLRVINRGFGGSVIADATHFADRIILPYQPKMIFFRSGGNDLAGGMSSEEVFADYKRFVEKIHAALPETDIVFISASPSIKRWKQHDKEKTLNALVEEYSRQQPHLKYIETYDMVLGPDGKPRAELFVEDQLHFSEAGYTLLAERVRPFMPK